MAFLISRSVLGIALALLSFAPSALAAKNQTRDMGRLTPNQEIKLEGALTKLVTEIVAEQDREPGQGAKIIATVEVVSSTSTIVISMSRSFLASDFSPAFEDQLQQISTEVMLHAYKQFEVRSVDLLIDGRLPSEYFPEYAQKDRRLQARAIRRRTVDRHQEEQQQSKRVDDGVDQSSDWSRVAQGKTHPATLRTPAESWPAFSRRVRANEDEIVNYVDRPKLFTERAGFKFQFTRQAHGSEQPYPLAGSIFGFRHATPSRTGCHRP